MLRLGATPVTAAADVLEFFGIEPREQKSDPPVGLAGVVLAHLVESAASIDELARASGAASGEVSAVLIELELAGWVSEADGVYRAAVRP